jgi:hypothetical protein
MTLTVKEKEHWKERISRKIDQAIDALCAEHDPAFHERTRIAARQRAIESLGIAEPQKRLAEIKNAKDALEAEERTVYRTMVSQVIKTDGLPDAVYLQQTAIDRAIRDRQKVHEKELLAADPLGRQILQLQLEQEDLLDTVWLATSPVQIKQLWNRVAEILNQKPTTLQQHALSLEPVTEKGA